MTVALKITEKRFNCDGATTVFPLADLIYLDPADLIVKLVQADGTAAEWTDGVQYVLSGDGTVGAGVLTASGPADAAPQVIYVRRHTDDIQNQEFADGDGFPSENVGNGFDRRAIRSQELAAWLSRALTAPDTDLPLSMVIPSAQARAGYLQKYDDVTGAPVNSVFKESDMAAAISVLLGARPGPSVSKMFYMSAVLALAVPLTFQQVNDAAAAVNGTLVMDADAPALTGNVDFTAPNVILAGGKLPSNGHNITFHSNWIMGGASQWLDITGGGNLLGTIKNTAIYPEWTGFAGGNAAGQDVANRKTLQALENFHGQSGVQGERDLIFQGIGYVIDQPITNPTAGMALRWKGQRGTSAGPSGTHIYSTANTQIRIMIGGGPASGWECYNDGLVFSGWTAGGATACLEIRDWCGNQYRNMLFDQNAIGVLIRDHTANNFAENVRGENNNYSYGLTLYGIHFVTDGGTASFRGFSETNFIFSRSDGTGGAPLTANRFIKIEADGSYVYGASLKGTVTNHTSQPMWIVDCASFGCYWKETALDMEAASGAGTITIGKTSDVWMGGHYVSNGDNSAILAGTAIFDCTAPISGTHRLNKGWTTIPPFTISTNGAPFTLVYSVIFGTTAHIQLIIYAGFSFLAYVDAWIFQDPIGSNYSLKCGATDVHVLYNGLSLAFDNTHIGVTGAGLLTFSLNAAGHPMSCSGLTEYTGGSAGF